MLEISSDTWLHTKAFTKLKRSFPRLFLRMAALMIDEILISEWCRIVRRTLKKNSVYVISFSPYSLCTLFSESTVEYRLSLIKEKILQQRSAGAPSLIHRWQLCVTTGEMCLSAPQQSVHSFYISSNKHNINSINNISEIILDHFQWCAFEKLYYEANSTM